VNASDRATTARRRRPWQRATPAQPHSSTRLPAAAAPSMSALRRRTPSRIPEHQAIRRYPGWRPSERGERQMRRQRHDPYTAAGAGGGLRTRDPTWGRRPLTRPSDCAIRSAGIPWLDAGVRFGPSPGPAPARTGPARRPGLSLLRIAVRIAESVGFFLGCSCGRRLDLGEGSMAGILCGCDGRWPRRAS
jgi:hypothetical protein